MCAARRREETGSRRDEDERCACEHDRRGSERRGGDAGEAHADGTEHGAVPKLVIAIARPRACWGRLA